MTLWAGENKRAYFNAWRDYLEHFKVMSQKAEGMLAMWAGADHRTCFYAWRRCLEDRKEEEREAANEKLQEKRPLFEY